MKKMILLTIVSAFSISLMAQDDDMYFVPTKENLAKEAKMYGMPQNVFTRAATAQSMITIVAPSSVILLTLRATTSSISLPFVAYILTV